MIVFSEASDQLPPSASTRDLFASTEAAKIAGCKVYTIPPEFCDVRPRKKCVVACSCSGHGDSSRLDWLHTDVGEIQRDLYGR